MRLSLLVGLWMLPFALLAQAPDNGPTQLPALSAEAQPEQLLRQYPLGAVRSQDVLAAYGQPDSMGVLQNGLLGWEYTVDSGEQAEAPGSYTLVFGPNGRVIDILYRRDGNLLSARQLRGASEPYGYGAAPGQGWGWNHMQGYGYGPHWGGGYGMGGWWGIGFAVLFAVLAVGALLLLVRPGRGSRRKENTALRILEERYARGELEAEEFEQRRKALRR